MRKKEKNPILISFSSISLKNLKIIQFDTSDWGKIKKNRTNCWLAYDSRVPPKANNH